MIRNPFFFSLLPYSLIIFILGTWKKFCDRSQKAPK